MSFFSKARKQSPTFHVLYTPSRNASHILHENPLLKAPHQTKPIHPTFTNRKMSLKGVHLSGKVPFSWENSPGISKVDNKEYLATKIVQLPPPPFRTESHKKVAHQDLQVPLPPCPFQPPLSNSSKKGLKKEDPFLAAYRECTKSVRKGKVFKDTIKRKGMSVFSCKQSCGVRDDGLVRVAHLSPRSNTAVLLQGLVLGSEMDG